MKFVSLVLFLLFPFFLISQETRLNHEGKTQLLNVGGNNQLEQLIFTELNYPQTALESEIEGFVQFNFNLKQNGELKNLTITGNNLISFQEVAEDLFYKIDWIKTVKRPQDYAVEFALIFNPKKFSKIAKKRGYQEVPKPTVEVSTSYKPINFNEVSTKPEPIFKEGNYKSADHYFNSKIRYPESAIRLGLKGPVVMEYIIEASGNVTNINFIESLGGGCNEEAIRVLTSLKWKPGIEDGKVVRVKAKTQMVFGPSY